MFPAVVILIVALVSHHEVLSFRCICPTDLSILSRRDSYFDGLGISPLDVNLEKSLSSSKSKLFKSYYKNTKEITFVSSNSRKVIEVKEILGFDFPWDLSVKSLDIVEPQASPVAVSRAKCQQVRITMYCIVSSIYLNQRHVVCGYDFIFERFRLSIFVMEQLS